MRKGLFLCVLCVLGGGTDAGTPARLTAVVGQDFSPALSVDSTVRIGFLRGTSYDVATLPTETYVARVLAGEAAPASPPAALEALAIAIRTYAAANRGRHDADGFDLCDQTHCQVVRSATAATERAAQASAGQVLLHAGAPASIYYSASCGGRTEIPSAVWPGTDDPPFLPSQDDDACGGAPEWVAALRSADLSRAFSAVGFRGTLRNMRIVGRNGSGRVARLALDGMTPGEISGQDLRMVVGPSLGWLHIKSAAFELQRTGNTYRFSGRGFGHGVGLCVIGSVALAAAGTSAPAILARYFPGLVIGPAGPSLTVVPARPAVGPPASARDIIVLLPEGDEGEREGILTLARRARDELAQTLGVIPPSPVTLRFHPTTSEYERITGQPWFTSSAAAGGELHLVPLAILRDRGMLERTIRRRLLHVMTAASLANRPAWVHEGAAMFFADREASASAAGAARPEPRGDCPEDAELLRPVSAGALADAYARARACFTRQIAAGRSWRDVR